MSQITLQVRRQRPTADIKEAAALLEHMVNAVAPIVPLDAVLWDYRGCPDGVLGFDVARAIDNAEVRSAAGALIGWTVRAATANKSVELTVVLKTQVRKHQPTGVFSVKLPVGVHSAQQLSEMCAILLRAFGGDEASARNEGGVLLEIPAKVDGEGKTKS